MTQQSSPDRANAFSICQPVRPVTLVTAGPVSEDLSRQCQALGLRFTAAPDGAAGGTEILTGPASTEAVRHGLALPYHGFIELGPEGLLGVGLRCFETARAGGLALSLTTGSAYTLSTLELVSAAVRATMAIPSDEMADLIDICLGEALSNAVMHGNLEVPAHLRIDAKGFQMFRQVMHERLQDPVLACRRIEISMVPRGDDHLVLTVSDQGRGFDLAAQLNHPVDSAAKSGRGLGLISRICASLFAEDGGRTLVMTFAR